MKSANRKTLIPKLRFPEFNKSGDWHLRSLSCLVDPISDRVGERNFVPMSISTGVGLVSQEDKFGRTIAGDSYKKYFHITTDDFAYNKSSTKEFPQGYIARYSGNEDAAVPNSIFVCFRPNTSEVIPEYLDYLFHSNYHGRWLRKYITVGARAHGALSVSEDDLMAMPVPMPPVKISFDEQKKIADCIGSLNDLAEAEGQKLETLKQHKIGLLQNFFCQKDEMVPALRFPEFRDSGKWKIREAGSIFGNRVNKGEHGLPLYSVTMHDGMVRRDSLERNYYDIEDAAKNKKACKDDIVYNMMRMWQGALGVATEDCLVSPAYIVLEPKKNVVPKFFEYLFKLPKTLQQLTAHSRGLTEDRLRLYYDDFSRILLPCPDGPEQQRIADCLTSLDQSITEQVRRLDSLNLHKRGLLQQLYPSVGVDQT